MDLFLNIRNTAVAGPQGGKRVLQNFIVLPLDQQRPGSDDCASHCPGSGQIDLLVGGVVGQSPGGEQCRTADPESGDGVAAGAGFRGDPQEQRCR